MTKMIKIDGIKVEKVLHWNGYDVYMPPISTKAPVPLGKVKYLLKDGKVRLATIAEFDEIILRLRD